MSKLIKKKIFWFLLVFIISIPAFSFLLKPGYYNMHDDMQMVRQLEMEKCLKDGQIPCRWVPDLGYGYGYPLFNFYPPMPYFVGQIFRFFGSSFVVSAKLTAALQIILTGIFMFILASSIFGNLGGLISSVFYIYAPYHALNIYIRGAMNEAWAAVFFPLIFYFSKELIIKKKFWYLIGLSVSFAGLLLSHNPMVLTFTPFFFFWCLFWLFSISKKNLVNRIIFLSVSGVSALALSAFFTLPAILETKYVQIESMFTNYYNFSVHFATFNQLFFSNFWGDGPSVWGPEDGMSFMIGYLHWIIPCLIFLYFIFNSFKNKKIDKKFLPVILLIVLGLFSVFMIHNKSTFLWLIFTPIQKIQFPWRFLNHTVFLFSLSVGIIPYVLSKFFSNKKINLIISLILLISVFALNVNYFHPLKSGPLTDKQKFSGLAWTNQITSGIYDYLPKTAKIAAKGPAGNFIDEIDPKDEKVKIFGTKKGTDWLLFNLILNKKSKVTVAQIAFPNFEIMDNGQKINYAIDPELGRMVLNLDSGEHQIYIKLKNTPIRSISNIISLIAWTLLISFLLRFLWMKIFLKKYRK